MRTLCACTLSVILGLSVIHQAEARKYSYDEARHGINIYYGEIVDITRVDVVSRSSTFAK